MYQGLGNIATNALSNQLAQAAFPTLAQSALGNLGSQVGSQVASNLGTTVVNQALDSSLMSALSQLGNTGTVSGLQSTVVPSFQSAMNSFAGASNFANQLASQGINTPALGSVINSGSLWDSIKEFGSKAYDTIFGGQETGQFYDKITTGIDGSKIVEKIPITTPSLYDKVLTNASGLYNLYSQWDNRREQKKFNEVALENNKYDLDRKKSENARVDERRRTLTNSYQNGTVI